MEGLTEISIDAKLVMINLQTVILITLGAVTHTKQATVFECVQIVTTATGADREKKIKLSGRSISLVRCGRRNDILID